LEAGTPYTLGHSGSSLSSGTW